MNFKVFRFSCSLVHFSVLFHAEIKLKSFLHSLQAPGEQKGIQNIDKALLR